MSIYGVKSYHIIPTFIGNDKERFLEKNIMGEKCNLQVFSTIFLIPRQISGSKTHSGCDMQTLLMLTGLNLFRFVKSS